MDTQMPEIDGLETARRIREMNLPHRQPHIIAMTANTLTGGRGINKNADAGARLVLS